MAGAGEEIDRAGAFRLIAEGGEAAHVTRHGRAVAGDIDDPLGPHGGDAFYHALRKPLARGIDGDDVGTQMLARELGSHIGGVAAEKFDIGNAVARGILPRVGDGLRHDLRAEDAPRVVRERERDGPRAAVEVEHGLLSREPRELDGLGVEPLGLRMVDLIEGRHAQAEGLAAEHILQPVGAPECAVALAEDHIVPPRVLAEDDAHRLRTSFPQPLHQLRLVRQPFAVHEQADQALALCIRADIDVAHEAAPRPLVVARHAKVLHIPPHGSCRGVRLALHQQARDRVDDLMRAAAVKADPSLR